MNDELEPPPPVSCCGALASGRGPSGTGASSPGSPPDGAPPRAGVGARLHRIPQAAIPGGRFLMGDANGDAIPGDGELPRRAVEIGPLDMDATTVTNGDFAVFAADAGYVTDAERFGSSTVFHLMVAAADEDLEGRVAEAPWWIRVRGASWRRPGGRRSSLEGLRDHPVVHVSWRDAMAYCAWAGRRLPSEAEWERAARGGLEGRRYPWGDESPGEGGRWRANIWQGDFPSHNLAEDGWLGTAPAAAFPPNAYGLRQMIGNVWEWCAPSTADADADRRPLRGGSHLCHASYCNRYRCSARSSATADSSLGHTGFRTVADA